ncbi:MAG: hypothetical protein ABEH89_01125, partial [bacterium]
PSLQSSFKLALAIEPVGSVIQDGNAAVVGRTGDDASMVPVSIELSAPNLNYSDSYSVQVVRNRYLSPGLINMAAANFASAKMGQLGLNRVESSVKISLKNNKDLTIGTTSITSGSFDPWAFLPISGVWNNRFDQIEVENVSIEMTMVPEQQSAIIEDVWLTSNSITPGEPATVFVRLKPYRGKTTVKKVELDIPASLPGSKAKLSVVPGSKLIGLQAEPTTSGQLISYLNNYRKDSKLAVVLQIPRFQMNAAGHNLPQLPYSITGTYERAHNSTASFKQGVIKSVESTPWVLRGQQSLNLPIKK